MNKVKVGVIMLGDSRREFFALRAHIAEQEHRALISALEERYEVFAPDTVFSQREAVACADQLQEQGIESIIIHIPIWATPSLSLRIAAATDLPVLLLGNKRTDTSSIVSLLAIAGQLSQVGKECVRVVGDSFDEPDVRRKLDSFITACHAVGMLRRSSFCLLGGRSIGIGTTVADPSQWEKLFGVEFDHCDQFEIVLRAECIAEERVRKHLTWLREKVSSIEYGGLFTAETLEKQMRSYLALKDMVQENGYDFVGIKCQQEMSDHYALQCLGVALLNNNCDADGPKNPIPSACESDCDGALTMKLLSMCAGDAPSSLVDIKYFDGDSRSFILANCGAVAPYFAAPDDAFKALNKAVLMPHVFGKAGGAAMQLVASKGEVTVARLFRRDGKYMMGCFLGQAEHRAVEELKKTTFCYPHFFIRADVDYDLFFQSMNSNHLHVVYGAHLDTLEMICRILHIDFLCYNC